MAGQLKNLPGQIHGAGKQSEPFCPFFFQPQSRSLDETDGGIDQNSEHEDPQIAVSEALGEAHDSVGKMAFRIDVQGIEDARGYFFHVLMHQGEHPDADEQRQQPFEGFKYCDAAQTEMPDEKAFS